MAYLPILDILRSYFDIKEEDQKHIIQKKVGVKISQLDGRLNSLFPSFQEILSLKVEDEGYLKMEPGQKKERAFKAIRDLFVRVSQEKPLVLVFEDLHWIDKTSEEFLDYLIGWLENTRILLILLYRPEYTHQWSGESYYTRIILEQLSTKASVELVEAILEGGDVEPEVKEFILRRAGGNPLFIDELTQSLLENGSIQRKEDQYVLTRKASDIQVPDTVQEIIATRINRVEESLKRIMQVASVIGSEFAFRILQHIMRTKQELKSYILSFEELAFLHEKHFFRELEYVFKHALTQEVAYDSLLVKRRKQIHERIGRAIEQIYAERLEEFCEMIAYHYSKGDNHEKAYQYLKLSDNKAARNYSNWEAFRLYREAIDILDQLPATEQNRREQIEVRLLISNPITLLGWPEDSLEILKEGEKQLKQIGDERSLSIFYSRFACYYTFHGEPLLGIKYTENPFREAEKIQDIELMAPIGCELCVSYLYASEFSKLIDVASKILALLEKTQRQRDFFGTRYNVYTGLCANCAVAFGWLGNFEEGKVLLEKGLHFALEVHSIFALGLLESVYGMLFTFMGDGKSAIEHIQESIRYLEEAQAVFILGPTWGSLGYGYYLMGELETAQEHIEKAIKMQKDEGIAVYLPMHFLYLRMVHFESADLKNAQNCIEEALRLSQKNSEKHWEGASRIWLGKILGKAETSQSEAAEEYILQGIKILDELKIKPWSAQGYLWLGELYADRGEKTKALENLKKAEGMFREMGIDYWQTRTQEILGRL